MNSLVVGPPSRRLTGLRLAVVGCGALGSELCRRLAEAGQRNVLVIDPDRLEPRNLALSRLFQQAERAPKQRGGALGKSKAQLVVRYAADLHGDSGWRAFEAEIADVGLADLRACDVLLCCADSTLARVETAFAARSLGLPMLDGAIRSHAGSAESFEQQGRVTWFAPAADAACSLCALGESRRAELLAYALSPSLGCVAPPRFEPMSGTPAIVEAVAEAMLDLLAARAGAGFDISTSSARIVSLESDSPQVIELNRSAQCPWHQFGDPAALVHVAPGRSFASSFAELPADSLLEFPWPICLRALCRACGQPSRPLRRTAYMRRRNHCPHCVAAGTLEPLECIDRIWFHHPLSERTPAELGLPVHQLYRLRPFLRLQ